MKASLQMVIALALATATGCAVEETNGRGSEIIGCTPGVDITVACGADGIGSCEGDPILTVCDGSMFTEFECGETGSTTLGRNDDSAGFCPSVTVECPASGELAVRPTAFSGVPTCNWGTREG